MERLSPMTCSVVPDADTLKQSNTGAREPLPFVVTATVFVCLALVIASVLAIYGIPVEAAMQRILRRSWSG